MMSRKLCKRIAALGTEKRGPWINAKINMRADLAKVLTAASENGVVAEIDSGRDCDMASWLYINHIPTPTVSAAIARIDRQQDGAEGPCGIYYDKPSRAPEDTVERDLILEAFEDGHAHCVYV
jgi:hypothetical protein